MKRLTATEAARNLSEVLNRVEYRDEEFEVERNGRVIARVVPARRTATVRDLFELLAAMPRDPQFADDLEEIQAQQAPAPGSPWDT